MLDILACHGAIQSVATSGVKTISACQCYRCGGVNGQWAACGRASNARRSPANDEYETSAKRLDRQHHSSDDGPVLAVLRGYPPVRGLVVGAYREASESADVHALLNLKLAAAAAKKKNTAETAFKEMVSRTPFEAEANLTLPCRVRGLPLSWRNSGSWGATVTVPVWIGLTCEGVNVLELRQSSDHSSAAIYPDPTAVCRSGQMGLCRHG